MLQGKEIQRLNNIYKNILKNNNVEHVEGRAYVKDAHTIQVFGPDGQVIREMTAANILVAVGGQPHRLGIPGSEHTITSDEALSLEEQPKRIAILGAGYIAVEFAGIFAGFGSDVHLFYRKDLPLTSAALLALASAHRDVQPHTTKSCAIAMFLSGQHTHRPSRYACRSSHTTWEYYSSRVQTSLLQRPACMAARSAAVIHAR